MNQKINYRPELDGLRTVAVLAVLIYHAKLTFNGASLLPGGFLGVDVFFVLSGFLISSIILKSEYSNDFNFFDFYISRAKRIFPALFVMLIVSSYAAYKIFLPDAFLTYGKSLIAASLFISNFYFFGEDAYVSESSDLKPLLHTWSLSVEWQFYLFFPIIILLSLRFLKNRSLCAVVLLWLISFAVSIYQAKYNINAAFYLLPSRCWELLSGCIVAMIGRKNNKLLSFFGMVMIIGALIFINDRIEHPSFPAVIPVLGTCLFIMYADHTDDLCGKIISWKPIVFIGTVSYSLYLWHQPIFVFYRVRFHEINNLSGVGMIVIAIIISAISYFFIEKPFRTGSYTVYNKITAVSAIIIIMSLSYYIVATNGDISRLSHQAQHIYSNFSELEFRRTKGNAGANLRSGIISDSCFLRDPYQACTYGDGSWVTIGDSYAGTFDYYLSNLLVKKGHGLTSLTYEQCPFVNNIWFGNAPECVEVNKRRWDIIKSFKEKKNIIIAANYYFFREGKVATQNPLEDGRRNLMYGTRINERAVWKSFSDNIKTLKEMGHNVILVYPIPSVTEDAKKMYLSLITDLKPKFDGVIYEKNSKGRGDALKFSKILDETLINKEQINIIRPLELMCDNSGCKLVTSDGALYNGGSHLSNIGVKLLFSKIEF